MRSKLRRDFLLSIQVLIGGVWIFHGLFSKLLNGIPRHQEIVAQILGREWAQAVILTVGVMEICLGLWVWSGWFRRSCALTQTLAITGMNTLEICFARELLVSAPWMIFLNLGFLTLAWMVAVSGEAGWKGGVRLSGA